MVQPDVKRAGSPTVAPSFPPPAALGTGPSYGFPTRNITGSRYPGVTTVQPQCENIRSRLSAAASGAVSCDFESRTSVRASFAFRDGEREFVGAVCRR